MIKKKNSVSVVDSVRPWWPLFLGPVTIAFVIGFVWPFFQGIYLSFCEFQVITDAHLSGFGNYIQAFQDTGFTRVFWYTALFAVVSLVIINVLTFVMV